MAHARLGGRVGIRRIVKPGAFFDQTSKAPFPLKEEFIDVVRTHLVHDQQYGVEAPSVVERRDVVGEAR